MLLNLARKQLRAGYLALIEEIKDFKCAITDTGEMEEFVETADWALGKLERRLNRIMDDDILGLIRRANTLENVARSWTLYEEAFESRLPTINAYVRTDGRVLQRRAISAGEQLVQKLYSTVIKKSLDLELSPRSIMVVPFLNRFYTGGLDAPVPYIAAPRWGYTLPWTWAGYAHEVGHHVFRNVKGFSNELKVNLTHHLVVRGYNYPMVSLWYNWLEEIFADLFGLLQIGPSFARTQQYIALLAIPRGALSNLEGSDDPRTILLYAHDFTHPTPYLRVEMVQDALDILEMADQEELDDLKKKWSEFLAADVQHAAIDTNRIWVRTHKIDDSSKISRETIELLGDTKKGFREISHLILRLILETPLISLADQDGEPRRVRDVFRRPETRSSELASDYERTYSEVKLPDDLEDIRDIVSWADLLFSQAPDEDDTWIKKISQVVLDRFEPIQDSRTSQSELAFKTYTAQEGDTIKKIAHHMYNDANMYELIRAANHMERGDKIEVGRDYMIPYFT